MLKIEAICDECSTDVVTGELVYCAICWDKAQEKIDELEKSLEDKIDEYKQLEEEFEDFKREHTKQNDFD